MEMLIFPFSLSTPRARPGQTIAELSKRAGPYVPGIGGGAGGGVRRAWPARGGLARFRFSADVIARSLGRAAFLEPEPRGFLGLFAATVGGKWPGSEYRGFAATAE